MLLAFSYSFLGGLRNSIKTDYFQMIIFLLLLLALLVSLYFSNSLIEYDLIVDLDKDVWPFKVKTDSGKEIQAEKTKGK